MSAENTSGKSGRVRMNFTLVEIIAVMGLMAILLFIALPAFEKLAKGSGVEIAARNLSSKLGAARGYAINSRQYVAVLMPDANLPNDYLFRSYKLCVVSSTSTSSSISVTSGTPSVTRTIVVTTFTFNRWLPSENWGFLPTGAAINHINVNPHLAGSNSNSVAYPDGWLESSHEEIDGVKLSEISSAYASVDNVRAIVFKPSGKLAEAAGSSESRYIAVSESTYSGTILVPTNHKNWIDIFINEYTGRVSYGVE